MQECGAILGRDQGHKQLFRALRLVMLVEAGTHLVTDALLCPYRMGERVRALRLLRSVTAGMLLMWDRGLHSYKMVRATLDRGCHLLGRVPANAKFEVVQTLADGSYLRSDCARRQVEAKGWYTHPSAGH